MTLIGAVLFSCRRLCLDVDLDAKGDTDDGDLGGGLCYLGRGLGGGVCGCRSFFRAIVYTRAVEVDGVGVVVGGRVGDDVVIKGDTTGARVVAEGLILFDVGGIYDTVVGVVADVDHSVVGGGERDGLFAGGHLDGAGGDDGGVVGFVGATGRTERDSDAHCLDERPGGTSHCIAPFLPETSFPATAK